MDSFAKGSLDILECLHISLYSCFPAYFKIMILNVHVCVGLNILSETQLNQ